MVIADIKMYVDTNVCMDGTYINIPTYLFYPHLLCDQIGLPVYISSFVILLNFSAVIRPT